VEPEPNRTPAGTASDSGIDPMADRQPANAESDSGIDPMAGRQPANAESDGGVMPNTRRAAADANTEPGSLIVTSRRVERAAPFFVVVPFYNEAAGMAATLEALAAQSDSDFGLVLVDNASTDASAEVARAFARRHPHLDVEVIYEPRKGTGRAADTGFRYAIARGARFIARTDADCRPDEEWVRNLKRAFVDQGLEFVAGRIRPRTDDFALSRFDRLIIPVLLWVAEAIGKLRRRGRQFKYPYMLAAGNNLAITAELYLRAGGFGHTAIEQEHEDTVLAETVRTLTSRGGVCRGAVVYNSTRRVKRYGYARTALWYLAHWCRPAEVDVR
jgi:glycosyltransferase involved in cell wall biosynthesis